MQILIHGMICLVSCEQSELCPSLATSPVQTTEQLYTRTQCTALIMSPPPTVSSVQDNITNNHIRPEIPRKVKQQHDSSRQVRVMMGGGRSLHQLLLHVPLMPGRPPSQAQLWVECVCKYNPTTQLSLPQGAGCGGPTWFNPCGLDHHTWGNHQRAVICLEIGLPKRGQATENPSDSWA